MTDCAPLEDFRTPINLKLALAWASLMFLYIYNDYFSLYTAGTIDAMAKGSLGPIGPATDTVLTGLAMMLVVPSLMIFLSAAVSARLSRWLNIVFGVVYTVVEVLTLFGSPLFYRIVIALEIALTVTILVHALRWPRLPRP